MFCGKLPLTPGDQYEVVTVTINPWETFDLAKAKKQTYLAGLDKPEAAAHWHFLTDYANNSEKLAAQVGFKYRWDPRHSELCAHGGDHVSVADRQDLPISVWD